MGLGAGSFKRWAIVRNADSGLFELKRLFENEVATQVPEDQRSVADIARHGRGAALVEITRDGLTVETVRGTVWDHYETDGEKAVKELRKLCARLNGVAMVMES